MVQVKDSWPKKGHFVEDSMPKEGHFVEDSMPKEGHFDAGPSRMAVCIVVLAVLRDYKPKETSEQVALRNSLRMYVSSMYASSGDTPQL